MRKLSMHASGEHDTIFPMLSVFPTLFNFMLFGPTVLRIVLGGLFMARGWRMFKNRERSIFVFESIGLRPGVIFMTLVATIEIVCGFLVFIGLFLQPAAIVIAFISFVGLLARISKPNLIQTPASEFVLLVAVSLSLLVLGPGLFAFDLPL